MEGRREEEVGANRKHQGLCFSQPPTQDLQLLVSMETATISISMETAVCNGIPSFLKYLYPNSISSPPLLSSLSLPLLPTPLPPFPPPTPLSSPPPSPPRCAVIYGDVQTSLLTFPDECLLLVQQHLTATLNPVLYFQHLPNIL